MKPAKCKKCNVTPEILQAAVLTVIRCPRCEVVTTALFGKLKGIRDWNQYQKETPRKVGETDAEVSKTIHMGIR